MVASATRFTDPLKTRTRWTKEPLRLRGITWATLSQLGGLGRIAIINDFRRHRIPIQMRLDLEAAAARVLLLTDDREQADRVRARGLTLMGPHEESYLPSDEEWPEVAYTFDGEWRDYPALVAFWFHAMRTQRREFGSSFVMDGYAARRDTDGEKVLIWQPKNVGKVEIFQWRAMGDLGRAAHTARTPGGLIVPRAPAIPDIDSLPVLSDEELAGTEDFLTGNYVVSDDDDPDAPLYDEEATADDEEPAGLAVVAPKGARRSR